VSPDPAPGVPNREPSAGRDPSHRSWARPVGLALVVALVAVAALLERHQVAEGSAELGHLRWWWVLSALVCESASMVAFARMQRRLLRAGGLAFATGSMVAITYAGNAISVSLPVAGSGLGTAYQYRAYTDRGASRDVAAWVLAVSGVVSTVAFALVLVAGALASGSGTGAVAGGAAGLILALPVATLVVAIRHDGARRRVTRQATRVVTRTQRVIRRPAGDPGQLVGRWIDQLAGLRLSPGSWSLVWGLSAVNWLADVACLGFAMAAVGAPVPWKGLILAWGAGAAAASLGLTPGGLGTVEAALAAGLIALGLKGGEAFGAVLLYRLISFWLVLAVGWTVYALVRPRTAPA